MTMGRRAGAGRLCICRQRELQHAGQQVADAHGHLAQLQQQMDLLAAATREAEAGADAAAGVCSLLCSTAQCRYWGQGPNLSTCQQANGSCSAVLCLSVLCVHHSDVGFDRVFTASCGKHAYADAASWDTFSCAWLKRASKLASSCVRVLDVAKPRFSAADYCYVC
jgi:hypothetical protein